VHSRSLLRAVRRLAATGLAVGVVVGVLAHPRTVDARARAMAPRTVSPRADGALSVIVSGFTSRKGQLMLALHNSRSTFLTRSAPYRAAKMPITADSVRYEFQDLPAGSYSVSAFHDENSNNDLDGVLRIPTERYGFSRNPKNRFGPPSYEATVFAFAGRDTTIVIALRDALSR
jgi:uncharacterized protein (DUF2141 family)